MPRVPIGRIDDPRLDPYRHLTRTNLTRWSGLFIAEGKRVVQRLVASGLEIASLLVSDRREAEVASWLPPDVDTYVVPLPVAQELVGFNFHTGILGCGRRRPPLALERFLADRAADPSLTVVVLPYLTDPENLGAIIRNAAGFGVDLLLLGKGCGDPFARRVLRVSMGTAFQVPFVASDDLHRDLAALRGARFDLAATVLADDAEPLHAAQRGPRLALLFGNESEGLAPEWIEASTRRLTIPMAAGTDSLNVSVAAGIFLHHFAGSRIC